MNELQFQRHLIKAAIDLGGHAFKMSNRFLVGVQDLFVKLPGQPSALIECKHYHWPVKSTVLKVEATPKQLHEIVKTRKAGQSSGICAIFETTKGEGWIVAYPAGENRDYVKADVRAGLVHSVSMYRSAGEKWPIQWVMEMMR